jgi:DNA-binding SARP family transcriptional activator
MNKYKIFYIAIAVILLTIAKAYPADNNLEKKEEIIAQYITEDPSDNDIN